MMRGRVPSHVRTTLQVRGKSYCDRYPDRAGDLWVVTSVNRKKDREYIGPPTEANRRRADEMAADLNRAHRTLRSPTGETFGMAAAEYLRVGVHVHKLAPTTRDDRGHLLSEKAFLRRELGGRPLSAITPEMLLDRIWTPLVVEHGRAATTANQYLASVSGVFAYAMERGTAKANPVRGLRETLSRQGRTKASRVERDATHAEPIEPLGDLAALVDVASQWRALGVPRGREASEREKVLAGDLYVVVLLLLDAGLRLSEALGGLRWRDVWWGKADGVGRHLNIEQARARGQHDGAPKSGRARKVDLSRRLRAVLRERWIELGQPKPDALVVQRRDHKKFRAQFMRACEVARIKTRRPKQLRDSFGSYLLTAGIQLGYIQLQLGHANAQVTARHYARYVSEGGYRAPIELLPGEVPADLIARLGTTWAQGTIQPESDRASG